MKMEKSFPILNHESYLIKTSYQKPTEVALFSYDEKRQLLLNSRAALSTYKPTNVGANLTSGFPKQFIKRSSENEHIDALLKSIENSSVSADIITWRGVISKFLVAPYSDRDKWKLNISKYKNTIYIEQGNADTYGDSYQDQLNTYIGYKFENLSCETPSESVNTNIQFCSVFKSKIGSHSLLLGGEVDAILDDFDPDNHQASYIELKTNKVINNDRQLRSFEKFKLIKVWSQSFLSGVSRIIIGFRNDDGILVSHETIKTMEIPRRVRENGYWDPNVCLGFLDVFVTWLKKSLKDIDSKEDVYTLEFDGKSFTITGPVQDQGFLKIL